MAHSTMLHVRVDDEIKSQASEALATMGLSVSDAVDQTIQTELTDKNGRGGLIALDAKGNIKFGFNTEGMYRGYIQNDGKPVAMVYRD